MLQIWRLTSKRMMMLLMIKMRRRRRGGWGLRVVYVAVWSCGS